MRKSSVLESLCYYDLRNPDGVIGAIGIVYENLQELKDLGYKEETKRNCSCDNCFYGRSLIAEELLKSYNEEE